MRKECGSALITVVLVVLVLTMVGLAGALYMTVEDKISQNDELQKEAFYAAESGLRAGEGLIVDNFSAGKTITNLLQHVSTAATPAVTPEVPKQPAYDTATMSFSVDNSHLGTYLTDSTGSVEYANQLLPEKASSGTPNAKVYYSLYVRNNESDTTGTPTTDQDLKFNLICVGWIQDSAGKVLASKILEEGFDTAVKAKAGPQANLNQSGTNSGSFGGG